MEVHARVLTYVHVHWGGLEQDVQVSNDRCVDIDYLVNFYFLTFQQPQHVQRVTLGKQDLVHASISKLT